MKRRIMLAVVVIGFAMAQNECFAASMVVEEDKVFTSNGVIQYGDLYRTVSVYDTAPDHTTINMTGGSIYYLDTHDQSTVNLSGGYIGDPDGCGCATVMLNESSSLNVYEDGTIIGGSFGYLELYDSSILNVSGGSVNTFVVAYDSSTVNIRSGFIMDLGLAGNSIANVYGGTIDIWGDWGNMFLSETVTVNIYGHGFTYNPKGQWRYPDDPSDGVWISKLTGIGPDGTEITWFGLPDPSTHSNINIVPEPSTLLIFLIGGVMVIRKKG